MGSMASNAAIFRFRYDRWCGWILRLFGSGQRFSRVVVTETGLDVQLGFAFRGVVPRSSIKRALEWQGPVYGWGAHGWRGKWLVNGSSRGIVVLHIDPHAKGRVLGYPVKVRELALSMEDPETFCQALELPLTVPQDQARK